MSTIERTSLVERVRESVIQMIAEGKILPDQKLTLENLSAQVGVSFTPLREALAKLEMEGFVTLEPYRGYRILSPFNKADLELLFDTLSLIEVQSSELAALHRSNKDLVDMSTCLHRIEMITLENVNWVEFFGLDIEFHQMIVTASGNPYLDRAYRALKGQIYMSWILAETKPSDFAIGNEEHREVLHAVLSQDVERVRRSMEDHLRNTLNRVLARINR